jgi:hypothetical protein
LASEELCESGVSLGSLGRIGERGKIGELAAVDLENPLVVKGVEIVKRLESSRWSRGFVGLNPRAQDNGKA